MAKPSSLDPDYVVVERKHAEDRSVNHKSEFKWKLEEVTGVVGLCGGYSLVARLLKDNEMK